MAATDPEMHAPDEPSAENREHRRGYDVFVSYSHTADSLVAPVLQRLIRRVGRPWYSRGTLRVFRDRTNLPMAESLWGSIEAALARSASFVLMASPAAAQSPWVEREVAFWRTHRERSAFTIVLTAGDIAWDTAAGDFDWARTDALPRALSGWYTEEPAWLDVRPPAGTTTRRSQRNDRLRDAARTIAAPLHGLDKDQLDGEDERESRRARRTLVGGVVALSMALVVAVVLAVVAFTQLQAATEQARISLAGQLAAVSSTEMVTNLDVANLLAVAAYRTDPSPRSRSALFRAATTGGQLVRYLPFPSEVQDIAGSTDGMTVAVGLRDGTVWRWRISDPAPVVITRFDGPAIRVAISGDGNVVLAADGASARLVRPGLPPVSLGAPIEGAEPTVAVSESGRTAAVARADTDLVEIYDLVSGDLVRSESDPLVDSAIRTSVMVTSDAEVLLLDGAYGTWERRRVADWALLAGSDARFTNANRGVGVAADGASFAYADDRPDVAVWTTDGPTDPDLPGRILAAPIANPVAVALSPDGRRGAVADTGTVYVGTIGLADAPRAEATSLVGNGSVDPEGVQFLGSMRIVAAIGDRIALWDLERIDRTARSFTVPMNAGCRACPGPEVAVTPDGTRVAAIDGSGNTGIVVPFDAPGNRETLPQPLEATFVRPIWNATGTRLSLVMWGTPDTAQPLPHQVSLVPSYDRPLAAGLSADGADIVLVYEDRRIEFREVSAGTVRRTLALPGGPARPQAVAVSQTSELVAVADENWLAVLDTTTGEVRGIGPGSDVGYLAFAGTHLLVQRASGALEVWNEHATERERVVPGDGSYIWAPVPSPNGRLVARPRSDSSITLVDLASGTELATFPPVAGSQGLRVGVGFSADGGRLVTVTENAYVGDGVVVSREISDAALVRSACAAAGRDLTQAEWATFVAAEPPADLACRGI